MVGFALIFVLVCAVTHDEVAPAESKLDQCDDSQVAGERAAELLDQGRPREAIEILTVALDQEPSAEIFMARGVCWLRVEEYEKAAVDFSRGMNTVTELGRELQAMLAYSLATAKSEMGETEAALALDAVTFSIDLCPNLGDPRLLRSTLHVDLGEFQAAIDDFSVAIETEPLEASHLLRRARIWYELAEYANAIADINEILTLTDEKANFHRWRALCEIQLGQCDAAIRDLTIAMDTNPDCRCDKAMLATALVEREPRPTRNDLDRAIALAEELCDATDWQDDGDLQILANVLSRAGDWQRAIEVQRKAVQNAP